MSRVRERGALEGEVLHQLRAAQGTPLSARDLAERFTEPRPAVTTLLTILDRLHGKGLVRREELSPRRVRFTATQSGEEHASAMMLQALREAEDPRAVLLRFAGNLDSDDVAFLQSALGGTDRRADRDR